MKLVNLLLFVVGAAAGGFAGFAFGKAYAEKKFNESLEAENAIKDRYKRILNGVYGVKNAEDEEKALGRESGIQSPEERRTAKEYLKEDTPEPVNYSKMYKREEDDQDEDEDHVQTEEEAEEEIMFNEHRKNMDRPPRIISQEDYSNLPAHIENTVLTFYAYDEILCDEHDEPIDCPEIFIGDALTKYGFIDNDEAVIFVMNYAMDTCFEVSKVKMSYTDSH